MWIELHDTAREHPKILKLARDLGITRIQALGHMASLWTWVLRMAPDGCLDSFDADDIEIAVDWDGRQGEFFSACVIRGLIDDDDGSIKIHDWDEFAGSLKAAGRARQSRERKKERQSQNSANACARVRTKEHGAGTRPDQTRPDQTDQTRPDQTDQTRPASTWPAAISTTADFEQAIAEWGWSVSGLSPRQRAKVSRITKAGVITRDEYEHAKASADGKDKPVAYFLSVVEGERKQATEEANKPSYPPKQREPERSGCWARDLSDRSQRDE